MQPDPTVSVEDVIQLARSKWEGRYFSLDYWAEPIPKWCDGNAVELSVYGDQNRNECIAIVEADTLTALAAAIKEEK